VELPRAALAVAFAGSCLACGGSGSAGAVNSPCTRQSDCAQGLSCGPTGVCMPPDAGREADASTDVLDSGPHDASAGG